MAAAEPALKRASTVVAPAALAALLAAGVAHLTFLDPDMLPGMALVREALAIGRLPLEDRFAYTPTLSPVIHHEWGTAAILYFTTAAAGPAGILVLKYLLVAAIAAGCVGCARRRGARAGVLCPLMPVAIVMGWIGLSTIRAQMFTLMMVTALLFFLDRDRDGQRWWSLPWLALYLLWLNLHGGFVVGVVFFGSHVAEQLLRRQPVRHLLLLGVAMAALVAVNPYGLAYYGYLGEALRLDRGLISEWGPLWQAPPLVLLVYAVSLAVVAYAVSRQGAARLAGLLIVLLAACAALRHQRHLSIYAVVWLCYVPGYVQPTALGEHLTLVWQRHRRGMLVAWSAVAVAAFTAFLLQRPWHLPIPANQGEQRVLGLHVYPVGAVAYLEQVGFRGNLMTPFAMGAFVTWKLHPEVKVSIDGRFEAAYPPGALTEHVAFYQAQGSWEHTLARYPTDAVLVPTDRPLVHAMPHARGWTRVYRDDSYELYLRPGLHLPVVDRRGQRLTGTFP